MDQLRALEMFTRVVELGSFTAAAHALRVPRATATTLVQALERKVGARLLSRTTRKVAPTADGAVYYEEAVRLLRDLAEVESRLGTASARPRGRVRVDVPAAAGRHILASALPRFLDEYPEIVVEIGSTDRPVDLLGEGVDCVVRGGALHDESLVARRLGELPVVTCAAPAYLSRHGVPSDPDALSAHTFVAFFSARTGRVFEVDFARGERTVTLRPRHRVAANDADTWLALAAAGAGLVQAPASRNVRQHLARGDLVRVLPDWQSEPLPLFLAWAPARHLPARVRAFADWIVEVYADECAQAVAFVSDPAAQR